MADADTKKAAVGLLNGESSGLSDILGSLLEGVMDAFSKNNA